MNATFIQGRIDATEALIIAYEAAVLALSANNGVQSYTLDTGQDRQTVTRYDLPSLNRMLDTLMNRCATLEARLNGSNSLQGRPGW